MTSLSYIDTQFLYFSLSLEKAFTQAITSMCVCVRVCVWERERERETETGRGRGIGIFHLKRLL